MTKYLSADQLSRYLHISKRKLKYLLDHSYIPSIDTGKETYKYKIKQSDAEKFKRRMESDKNFLQELKGMFSSRSLAENAKIIYITSESQREEFKKYLTHRWQSCPDALPAKQAAQLTEITSSRINELVRKGKLYGVCIGNIQYISKERLIEYVAYNSPSGSLAKAFVQQQSKTKKANKT